MSSAPGPGGMLKPDPSVQLTTKQFIDRETATHRMSMQRMAAKFLFWAYGGSLAATLAIFFLQGFHVWGFNLDPNLLNWMGGATITALGGLLATVYGALFKK